MNYLGAIKSIHPLEDRPVGYVLIDIQTVTQADGSPHGLKTNADIFVHSKAFSGDTRRLTLGTIMEFSDVCQDNHRPDEGLLARFAKKSELNYFSEVASGGISFTVQGEGGGNILEHSSVFVSWCISPSCMSRLEKIAGRSVAMLLLIQYPEGKNRGNEARRLVPLDRPMEYLPFDAAGVHVIVGVVVNGWNEKQLRDMYLTKSDGDWNTDVLSWCGHQVLMDRYDDCITGAIRVTLPEGLFAKKPRDWKWVNRFFEKTPTDECAFRRRRFFAYTIQPVVVLANGFFDYLIGFLRLLVMGVCVIFFLMLGRRGINYEPLMNPMNKDYEMEEIWSRLGNDSVFVPWVRGAPYYVPIAVSPPIIVLTFIVGYLLWSTSLVDLLVFTCGVIPVIAGVLWLVTVLSRRIRDVDWIERIDTHNREQRLSTVHHMTISGTSAQTKPNPWKTRSVVFYYYGLKQRLCRGFSRR